MKTTASSQAAMHSRRAHKWLLISVCAAIAMVLGAMSVGAMMFEWNKQRTAAPLPQPTIRAEGDTSRPQKSDEGASVSQTALDPLPGSSALHKPIARVPRPAIKQAAELSEADVSVPAPNVGAEISTAPLSAGVVLNEELTGFSVSLPVLSLLK